jgi:hypothetical protein
MPDHEIIPLPGSAVRSTDNRPADLLNPHDYPVIAVCQFCQRPIECLRFYLAEWWHLDEGDAPLTGPELEVLERIIRPRPATYKQGATWVLYRAEDQSPDAGIR